MYKKQKLNQNTEMKVYSNIRTSMYVCMQMYKQARSV